MSTLTNSFASPERRDEAIRTAELERRRHADSELIRGAALAAWSQMPDNDRAIVRVGMIPLWAHEMHCPSPDEVPDGGRLFAVALMDCAKRDGGMAA